jgi:predicted negative regulator of RcsB-dependent stress response
MEDYETEEQQIDAIKKWWNENGTALLVGLGIGVAALSGWNYYTEKKYEHSIEASEMYTSIMARVESNLVDEGVSAKANKLVAEYTDTPYASLSSLALAKYEFKKGNFDAAVSHLKWVAAHGLETEVQNVARLRLARVLLDQKKYDEVETWLLSEHPAAFDARYQELTGDLYVALGEIEQARVAYDKALRLEDANASQWLRLKRQDLGASDFDTSKPGASTSEQAAQNEPPAK